MPGKLEEPVSSVRISSPTSSSSSKPSRIFQSEWAEAVTGSAERVKKFTTKSKEFRQEERLRVTSCEVRGGDIRSDFP